MLELNTEQQKELKHELASTKAGKEMKQKAMSEGLRNLKLTFKEKLFMANTHYKLITLMLTKRKPISGFVTQG